MNTFHQQCIKISPDVMVRRIGNEFFILNIKSECYFGLDDVGARMITLLTEGTSVGDTLKQLEIEYAADPEVLSSDLESLIGELVRHNLILPIAARAGSMSGIAGVVHAADTPVNAAVLSKMAECLALRGPDGGGTWVDGAAGLAYSLLGAPSRPEQALVVRGRARNSGGCPHQHKG